ncbi:condensation domain-containing protein [Bacillus subtilis]|uniref:condensation domain-containing protein n=1 Tax=Bacillus subtilis TaxID=1423 RepID=UPI003EB6D172
MAQVTCTIEVNDPSISDELVQSYWSHCVEELQGISPPIICLFQQQKPSLSGHKIIIKTKSETEALAIKKKYSPMLQASKDALMRATVFQTSPTSYRWIWSYHHILLDGWCFGLVVQELFAMYHALLHDIPYKLEPVKPYKEYIQWLEKQDKQASRQYWQQSLAGFDVQSTFKEQRKQTNEHELGEMEWSMSKKETAALSALAFQQNATLRRVLQVRMLTMDRSKIH